MVAIVRFEGPNLAVAALPMPTVLAPTVGLHGVLCFVRQSTHNERRWWYEVRLDVRNRPLKALTASAEAIV